MKRFVCAVRVATWACVCVTVALLIGVAVVCFGPSSFRSRVFRGLSARFARWGQETPCCVAATPEPAEAALVEGALREGVREALAEGVADEPAEVKELFLQGIQVAGSELSFRFVPELTVDLDTVAFQVVPSVEYLKLSHDWRGRMVLSGAFEHGATYQVTLKQGLKTEREAYELKADVTREVRFADASPDIGFLTQGSYLPLSRMLLPYYTQNTTTACFEVFRAFENNLMPFGFANWRAEERLQTEPVATLKSLGAPQRNVRISEMLDFGKLVDYRPGIYYVRGRVDEASNRESCWQWVVATDLGVNYCYDDYAGFYVVVRRLSTGAPVVDAEVEVAGERNQVLYVGKTQADGVAKLALTSQALISGDFPPTKMIVRTDDDLVYLDIPETRVHGWATGGKTPQPQIAMWTDRRLVRPGESVRLYGLVREPNAIKPLCHVPLTVVMKSSAGVALAEQQVTTDEVGLCVADFTAPREVMSGSYTLEVRMGKTFLDDVMLYVSDFVPDRIKVEATLEKGVVAGQVATYFGAPVAEAEAALNLSFSDVEPQAWKGWQVGLEEDEARKIDSTQQKVAVQPDGSFREELKQPNVTFNSPVTVTAGLQVSERGGRTVHRQLSEMRYFASAYVGLRKGEAGIEACLLADPAQTGAVEQQWATLALTQIKWSYELAMEPRTTVFRREWQEKRQKVELPLERVQLTSAPGVLQLGDLPPGDYQLVVQLESGVRSELSFEVAGGPQVKRLTDMRNLVVEVARSDYQPGDVVELAFDVPGDGMIFAYCGRDRILASSAKQVTAGRQHLSLPIPEDFVLGFLSIGIVFIPQYPDVTDRLFAEVDVTVDQWARQNLTLALTAQEVAHPGKTVPVKLNLARLDGTPTSGKVCVYAVDEGILAAGGDSVPNPLCEFILGSCNAIVYGDLYGLLYPLMLIDKTSQMGGDAALGGNGVGEQMLRYKEPARVVLPPVTIPESGELTVDLPVPADFQGALRLVAVAANEEGRVGVDNREMMVRPPMTLTFSVPRFGCPGDEAEIVFTATNHDLPEGAYVLTFDGHEVGRGTLAQGQSETLMVRQPLPASETLTAVLTMGEEVLTVTEPFLCREPVPMVRTVSYSLVQPGEAVTAGQEVPLADAALRATDWLAAYLYDCTEQLSCSAWPYLNRTDELAKASVRTVARRLLTRWRKGGFTLWDYGSYVSDEASLMACHVVLSAFRMKALPENAGRRREICKVLRERAERFTGEERAGAAFALWVLAQDGSLDDAEVTQAYNLMAVNEGDAAELFAAAALIKAGYAQMGVERFVALQKQPTMAPLLGYMDSPGMEGARVALAIDLGLGREIPVERLGNLLTAEWATTQANAWAGMALAMWGKNLPLTGRIIRTETTAKQIQPNQPIGVTRQIVDADGKVIDRLPHGQLAYVRVDVTLPKAVKDVAIRSLLPGGLEYEDASLATRESRQLPKWTERLTCFPVRCEQNLGAEQRFFGDADAGTYTIVYPVRAVCRGSFRVPATVVEAMYEPTLTGGCDAGQTFIVE